MAIVVSDTSPIRALAHLELLDALAEPLLDQLQAGLHFHISPALRTEILREAGELREA